MMVLESVEEVDPSPHAVQMVGADGTYERIWAAITLLHHTGTHANCLFWSKANMRTGSEMTPTRPSSSRRSIRGASNPPPRSTSPRKSGISGTARKGNGVDLFSIRKTPQPQDPADRENTPYLTPTRTVEPRRFSPSPEKSPLRDITNYPSAVRKSGANFTAARLPDELPSFSEDERDDPVNEAVQDDGDVPLGVDEMAVQDYEDVPVEVDEMEPTPNYDEPTDGPHARAASEEIGSAMRSLDDAEADSSSDAEVQPVTHQANSRKKRKSDAMESDEETTEATPSKLRKTGAETPVMPNVDLEVSESSRGQSSHAKGKQTSRKQKPKPAFSSRKEQALSDIIEKITARPARSNPLYILRRETPADNEVTHTRSGRVSVKPLAYWRNERCVYGGSPGSIGLADGARFPLNSIKEIVRTEQIEPVGKKKAKRGRKKGNGKPKARQVSAEDSESSDSDVDMDDVPREDPDAEPWETETGTLRGNVAIWDNEEQTPTEQEEEVEIAHAAAAIKTREVKASNLHDGPTFRYAKLFSTRFFGTGLVDLPPGGMKRPKNSRKMHMSFFVVKGRVTVTVGPVGSEETGRMTRFSIGKGGFWQVPRGESSWFG